MAIRDSVVIGLLVLATMLTQGCGATQRTLAQDLAWERWTQCSTRHPGMTLQKIDPDGRVWVIFGGDHRLAFNAWNDCMIQAAAEQGRPGATNLPPAVGTPAEPVSWTDGVAAPHWNIGDEWAYRYQRPSGTGTFVWNVARVEAIDGDPHYVVRSGTSREIFYREADFAFTRETYEGRVIRANRPSQWRWMDFPLTIGRAWEMRWTDERPPDRQTEDIARRCVAEAPETVTVPAGTFESMRIVCSNPRDGVRLFTFWYAPAVHHFVRGEFASPAGPEVRELIGYKLR